jgi:YHS domain-containing protein
MPLVAREGSGGPECIVSGGPGTIKVMYKGEAYYVCCSGCKAAFLDEPEKFIKELKEKQKKATK